MQTEDKESLLKLDFQQRLELTTDAGEGRNATGFMADTPGPLDLFGELLTRRPETIVAPLLESERGRGPISPQPRIAAFVSREQPLFSLRRHDDSHLTPVIITQAEPVFTDRTLEQIGATDPIEQIDCAILAIDPEKLLRVHRFNLVHLRLSLP